MSALGYFAAEAALVVLLPDWLFLVAAVAFSATYFLAAVAGGAEAFLLPPLAFRSCCESYWLLISIDSGSSSCALVVVPRLARVALAIVVAYCSFLGSFAELLLAGE